jgi:hypothetical protein
MPDLEQVAVSRTVESSPHGWSRFAAVYAALALLLAWFAVVENRRYHVSITQAAAIYACLLLLSGFYLAAGFAAPRAWLAARFRSRIGAASCVVLFLVPYLIYSAGAADFRTVAFAKLFALAAFPLALFVFAPVRSPERLNWQDVSVLLWLVAPVLLGWLKGIWNQPVNLDFMVRVFLVGVGTWSFLIFRGVRGSGYEFTLSVAILRDAAVNFAGFAVLAAPLGFAIRFIGWNPRWRGAGAFAFDYVTIFLFVAILEEFLFRGLIQNLLEGTLSSRRTAHACASVLFGLTHMLHPPVPNWRYVILATLAGWFYGSAYRKHRSIMASAATHALVDTAWRTWFTLVKL